MPLGSTEADALSARKSENGPWRPVFLLQQRYGLPFFGEALNINCNYPIFQVASRRPLATNASSVRPLR